MSEYEVLKQSKFLLEAAIKLVETKLILIAPSRTVGFGETIFGPGEIKTVEAIVKSENVRFHGKRLVIPSEIGGAFLITGLTMEGKSQLSAGPIPGRMFSEFSVGVDCDFDTVKTGEIIALTLKNTSDKEQTFCAGLRGDEEQIVVN